MSLSDKIEAFGREIEARSKTNLDKAADVFEDTLRDVLSEPGTNANPSRPGEAPHKVTGQLVGSIERHVNHEAGVAAIGPGIFYARILAKTRPYFAITMSRCAQNVKRVILDFKGRA